jgi:hypothetical protein
MVNMLNRPSTPSGLPVERAGFITELSHMAPMLAKRLAENLEKSRLDPRQIYKQTGWFRDVDGKWIYKVGDQAMRLTDTPIGRSPSLTGPAAAPLYPSRPALTGDESLFSAGGTAQAVRNQGVRPNPLLRLRENQPHPDQLDFADIPRAATAGFVPGGDPRFAMQFRPPTAGELFHHPMMFEATPELANVPMAGYQHATVHKGTGSYSGRDIGGPRINDVNAREGGLEDPESALSVALHELGHGEQDIYGRPYGGSTKEGGMGEFGKDVMKLARKREGEQQNDWMVQKQAGAAKEDILGDVPPGIGNQYRNYGRWSDLGNLTGYGPEGKTSYASSSPEYLGYMAQHGEAMARLAQRMAAMPTMKMTGDPGVYTTRAGELLPAPGFVKGPVEGDVHPFEALDIPPDLLYSRPQSAKKRGSRPVYEQGKFPTGSRQFDWLLAPWRVPKGK